jgi:hypothetical protein
MRYRQFWAYLVARMMMVIPVKKLRAISQEQFEILKAEIKAKADPNKVHKDILGFNKIERLDDLPATTFKSVKSYLEKVPNMKT